MFNFGAATSSLDQQSLMEFVDSYALEPAALPSVAAAWNVAKKYAELCKYN
jgi:hypothetical protein